MRFARLRANGGRSFAVGAAALFLALGVLVLVASPRLYEDFVVVRGVKKVTACVEEGDPVACARPYVKEMLGLRTGIEVMKLFTPRLSSSQCHYIGHLVGQELYNRERDAEKSLAKCDLSCQGACHHGIIGQALVLEAGFDDVTLDPQHLTNEQLKALRNKLCISTSTCHAVGHALLQGYRKFEPALAVCAMDRLSVMREQCYRGVFMQYADIITSRNAWEIPGVQSPEIVDLNVLCNFSSGEEKRACFIHFPRIARYVFAKEATKDLDYEARIISTCQEFKNAEDRDACAFGYGANSVYTSLDGKADGKQICAVFHDPSMKNSCVAGLNFLFEEFTQYL